MIYFSANRYAPIKDSYQNSSQPDRQAAVPYQSNPALNRNLSNITSPERRPFSPFQPPPPSQRSAFTDPQQVLYSDFDRGGEKWYPAGIMDPSAQQKMAPGVVLANKGPGSTSSQYMAHNQVYKYPQFNNADGEMHTVPVDTRYVPFVRFQIFSEVDQIFDKKKSYTFLSLKLAVRST